MPECEKYEEMISAYLDAELDENEARELTEHLQSCQACAALFKTYQLLFSATAVTPAPAGFTPSVMGMTSTVKAPQKTKKRAPVIRFLAAAAACLVLVAAAYPMVNSLFGRKASFTADTAAENQMAYNTATTGAATGASLEASYDLAVANEESAQNTQEESVVTEGGVEYGKNSSNGDTALFIVESPEAQTEEETDVCTDDAAAAEDAKAEPESGEIRDSGTAAPTGGNKLSASSILTAVYIHGELPDICSGLAFEDLGNGAFAAEISEDLARELIEMEYEHDEGDVRYLVWYPD